MYQSIRRPRLEDSGSIFRKYRGLRSDVKKIDAVFIWPGNGKTYLFSGTKYYRYDEWRQSIDPNYPRNIKPNWKGIPDNIDAVFVWKNTKTYFFKGKTLSINCNFTHRNFLVQKFCGNAVFADFRVIRPKLCGNYSLSQNFHTRKSGNSLVYNAVKFFNCSISKVSSKMIRKSEEETYGNLNEK